jgi:uroporphyrin-III C-methyltransferase
VVTTLSQLGQNAAEADTPAILVIGENVRLAEGLDWLGAITKGRVLDPDPLKRNRLSDAG